VQNFVGNLERGDSTSLRLNKCERCKRGELNITGSLFENTDEIISRCPFKPLWCKGIVVPHRII